MSFVQVEMGSKNHEIVPTPLIGQIAGLRGGSGVHKNISNLAKVGLIAKIKNAKYDGYRLTYGGLDYLSLNTHRKSSSIYSLGNQIGVGKESDIYVVASSSGEQRVLKIHRLGRISFRNVKANRDYLRNRSSGSWMYMSRLAAMKEYAFMRVLRDNGFPVPQPIAQNRHTLVMSMINAFPLRQIESVPDPASLYAELMSLIVRLAQFGLIHGDFNEFNILLKETKVKRKTKPETAKMAASLKESTEEGAPAPDGPEVVQETENQEAKTSVIVTPIIIDFPQMVSVSHTDAKFYFDRDVACIKRFFERRFKFTSEEAGPHFSEAAADPQKRLDVEVEASGFSRKMAKELEGYMRDVGVDGDAGVATDVEDRDEEDEVGGEGAEEEDSVDGPTEGHIIDQPENTSTNQDLQFRLESLGGLPGGMSVLDIADDEQEVPRSTWDAASVATTTRKKTKAAGWSI